MMDSAGDVDRDGFPDLVLGSGFDSRTGEQAGGVRVVSGKDFHLLFEVLGSTPHQSLGRSVWGVGDVNGDGIPDVAAASGAMELCSVFFLSGKDGTRLPLVLDGLLDLCPIGDADHDGCADLLVRTEFATSPLTGSLTDTWGSIEARSGRDGRLLYRIQGTSRDDDVGGAIRSVGDLDGDGACEFVFLRRSQGLSLRSGADGHEILELGGSTLGLQLQGWEDAGPAGDSDGDGTPDFIVTREGEPGHVSDGRLVAEVLSGRDGHTLCKFEDRSGLWWEGRRMCLLGDIDGCGSRDWGIGAPAFETWCETAEDRGRLLLVSGRRGTEMKSLRGEGAYSEFGREVAWLGDVNGDGIPEVACTEQVWSARWNKSVCVVEIYSGADLR